MNNRKIVCTGTAAVLVAAACVAAQSQSSAGGSKQTAKQGSSQVQHIVLPQYGPEIPDGPNVQVYEKDCLICHTARYVLMQPRFPKAVWQSEVKKMVDAYGASIPEADQPLIVEYLMAVKGAEASSPAASPK